MRAKGTIYFQAVIKTTLRVQDFILKMNIISLLYSLDFMYVILILINENSASRIILRYGFL